MTSDLQKDLDANGSVSIRGDCILDAPLFLGSEQKLYGPARLNAHDPCIPVIVGWRRGLIGDDCYTGEGFRTRQNHLYIRGTDADLGPGFGWNTIKESLTIHVSLKRHDPNWGFPIAGLQEGVYYYGAAPSPYLIVNYGTSIRLYLKMSNEKIYGFAVPFDPRESELVLTFSVNFSSKLVLAQINGQIYSAQENSNLLNDQIVPNPRWDDGLTLANNSRAPLMINRIDPHCNSSGSWGNEGFRPDVTVREYIVHGDGKEICKLYPREPRKQTYSGGPSLPLVAFSCYGSGYMLAVHPSQKDTNDGVKRVKISDIDLHSGHRWPQIVIGSVLGSITLESLTVIGCSRAIMSTHLSVAYPMNISDLSVESASDCGIYLYRTGWISVTESQINYAVRTAVELLGCEGVYSDIFIAPRDDRPQESVMIQSGGVIEYRRCKANYEYLGPSFLRLEPCSYDQDWMPTLARIVDCRAGVTSGNLRMPVLHVKKRPERYNGAINWDILNIDSDDSEVINENIDTNDSGTI